MRILSQDQRIIRLPPTEGRSYHRIHVSEIIRELAIRIKVLKINADDNDEEKDQTLMALGLAYEEWAKDREEERDETFMRSVGEFELDDIVGSPDGLSLPGDRLLIHEFKLTKKSGRHCPLAEQDGKWWMWLRQGMAYLKLVPDAGNVVRYTVCHFNGEYEGFRFGETKIVDYDIEFTQKEIDDNWMMIVANKPK